MPGIQDPQQVRGKQSYIHFCQPPGQDKNERKHGSIRRSGRERGQVRISERTEGQKVWKGERAGQNIRKNRRIGRSEGLRGEREGQKNKKNGRIRRSEGLGGTFLSLPRLFSLALSTRSQQLWHSSVWQTVMRECTTAPDNSRSLTWIDASGCNWTSRWLLGGPVTAAS